MEKVITPQELARDWKYCPRPFFLANAGFRIGEIRDCECYEFRKRKAKPSQQLLEPRQRIGLHFIHSLARL